MGLRGEIGGGGVEAEETERETGSTKRKAEKQREGEKGEGVLKRHRERDRLGLRGEEDRVRAVSYTHLRAHET